MKKILSILATLFAFSVFAVETEAARIGGGRSVGTQRSMTQQPAQKTAPAQQQQQQANTPPAQQPSGMSKWLGPLAGLALGAGLMSLFMNNGFAGALAGIMLMLAILAVAVFAFRFFTRRSSSQPLQYAGAGSGTGRVGSAPPAQQPAAFTGNAIPGSVAATLGGASAPAPAASRWPAGFDAAEFERQAKLNFTRLQAANDAGDASTLRDFMTPALYSEIEAQMKSAWGTPQKTEVSGLQAEVLDVATEDGLHIVSVRFTGDVRENDGAPQSLNEIWHLEKPVSGRSGWMVSGIQQA